MIFLVELILSLSANSVSIGQNPVNYDPKVARGHFLDCPFVTEHTIASEWAPNIWPGTDILVYKSNGKWKRLESLSDLHGLVKIKSAKQARQ